MSPVGLWTRVLEALSLQFSLHHLWSHLNQRVELSITAILVSAVYLQSIVNCDNAYFIWWQKTELLTNKNCSSDSSLGGVLLQQVLTKTLLNTKMLKWTFMNWKYTEIDTQSLSIWGCLWQHLPVTQNTHTIMPLCITLSVNTILMCEFYKKYICHEQGN